MLNRLRIRVCPTLESSSCPSMKVYGHKSWVILQRMTVPLIIFLRFHAFVLSIELDKEYASSGSVKGIRHEGLSNWELRSSQDIRMSY